jgi:hypothetical protein
MAATAAAPATAAAVAGVSSPAMSMLRRRRDCERDHQCGSNRPNANGTDHGVSPFAASNERRHSVTTVTLGIPAAAGSKSVSAEAALIKINSPRHFARGAIFLLGLAVSVSRTGVLTTSDPLYRYKCNKNLAQWPLTGDDNRGSAKA